MPTSFDDSPIGGRLAHAAALRARDALERPTPPEWYLPPSQVEQAGSRPSHSDQRRVRLIPRPHRRATYARRMLWLRIGLVSVLLSLTAGVTILGAAVWQSSLDHFSALAICALMAFALALLDVWAIPALYAALSWRALAVHVRLDLLCGDGV